MALLSDRVGELIVDDEELEAVVVLAG